MLLRKATFSSPRNRRLRTLLLREEQVLQTYAAYTELKKEQNTMDFCDVINELLMDMKGEKRFLDPSAFSKKYDSILVPC